MAGLPQVVALEADKEKMYLYFHEGDKFRCETRAFSPWFAAAEELEGATMLAGSLPLRYRVPGDKIPAGVPVYRFKDLRSAAMIESGIRLFEGMVFEELRRMQFMIEHEDALITGISMADNSGWSCQLAGSEKELLNAFVETINTRDPDVLEGYDFFRNDWEILKKSAAKNKVKLLCGRDGSAVTSSRSSVVIGERRLNYSKFECHGRHLIDVFLMLQLHDVSRRELESYDLDYAAEFFDLQTPSRVEQIGELSKLLTPAYFYCTGFIPGSYQEIALRGNGSKIDLLLTGAYLERGHSLPLPEPAVFFPGATSKVERQGIFAPVWHCDVRSLYPSILLAENLAPEKDELKLFPEILRELRRKRLEAKDRARQVPEAEKEHWNAMQSALKIVINSFYGYLGFAQGSFNDFALAAKVTARGREILALLTNFLADSGAEIIEMDTDGVYFTPPVGATPEGLEQKIQNILPDGIEIELDAVYEAMYSYKAKNYALLSGDGEVLLTGAALKSRGMEKYFRNVVKEIIKLRLTDRAADIPPFRERCLAEIAEHKVPLADLCKNETLNDSLANYQKKLASGTGRRSAVYELLLKAGLAGRTGDKIEYYITGSKAKVAVVDNSKLLSDNAGERDENILWYTARVEELFSAFSS